LGAERGPLDNDDDDDDDAEAGAGAGAGAGLKELACESHQFWALENTPADEEEDVDDINPIGKPDDEDGWW
jgi:hypothetical protein